MKGDHSSQRRQELPMSSNDDSPVSQPHPVEPSCPSSSNKNPQIDTEDALLRIIFRMSWGDRALMAIIILCLVAHYVSITQNCLPIVIDIIKLATTLLTAFFVFLKISSAYKSKELIISFFKIHPIQLFVSIIACGATVAFFLPLILNMSKFIGDTDKLTTALLASTGGVIAVFTLIKTHQKNQNDEMSLQLDREKYEQQKEDRLKDIEMQNSQMKEQKRQFNKKTKQEAYSSHQERIRQIHAERRSRYTTAVEQLANENAAVRLGGIYTLVKLADEWLTDSKTTPDETDRMAEGQIIINSLCSYIQSPYSLAEKRIFIEDAETFEESGDKFTNDRAALYAEQRIRQVIFNEISKRSSKCNDSNEIKPGKWSVFEFNFTRSPIFYSLNDINLENANFSNSIFYGITNFCGSTFYGGTNFTGVSFEENANFLDVTFQNGVDFTEAFFKKDADFSNATFIEDAIFDSTVFDSSIFQVNYTSFHGAKFHGNTSFYKSVFNAQTHFNKATFHKGVNFDNSCFEESPEFVNEKNVKESDSAGFSYKAKPNDYSFRIDHSYPGAFDTIQIDAPDGITFRIPEGCILFDPDS